MDAQASVRTTGAFQASPKRTTTFADNLSKSVNGRNPGVRRAVSGISSRSSYAGVTWPEPDPDPEPEPEPEPEQMASFQAAPFFPQPQAHGSLRQADSYGPPPPTPPVAGGWGGGGPMRVAPTVDLANEVSFGGQFESVRQGEIQHKTNDFTAHMKCI